MACYSFPLSVSELCNLPKSRGSCLFLMLCTFLLPLQNSGCVTRTKRLCHLVSKVLHQEQEKLINAREMIGHPSLSILNGQSSEAMSRSFQAVVIYVRRVFPFSLFL